MKTILCPVKGWLRGKELEQPYRAVLDIENDVVNVEEQFPDGAWITRPGWAREVIMESHNDVIAIDGGQEWCVSGMNRVREALHEHEKSLS